MAKSTRSGGKNARPAPKSGAAGGSSGRAQRPAAGGKDDKGAKDASGDGGIKRLARPSAKEAAAKAVSKGPTRRSGTQPVKGAAKGGGGDKPKPVVAKATGDKPSASVKRPPAPTKRTTPPASARYTPPVPKSEKVSPIWVPILMFTCLGVGMLTIILNYVNVLPGDDPSNAYLMVGLALITVGFITATKYH
jgi:hypothetical protein